MSEILVARFKENIGNQTKIFLINGFKFEGKILSCDDEFVEIMEVSGKSKFLKLSNISDLEISTGNGGSKK